MMHGIINIKKAQLYHNNIHHNSLFV